ncbi:hypothetical protein Hanom_Chr01g00062211 [Helianthus anomalus]
MEMRYITTTYITRVSLMGLGLRPTSLILCFKWPESLLEPVFATECHHLS